MHKLELVTLAVKNFNTMGLSVLLPAVDYLGPKPDMVIVHADKNKYYLVEIITDKCLETPMRLISTGPDNESRLICCRLYENIREAVIAAAIYCDLGQGVDLFRYRELKGFQLYQMQRYAAAIYPHEIASEVEAVFDKMKLQYKSLEILKKYYLTLFSQSDTNRIAEARKFMQFLVANKD